MNGLMHPEDMIEYARRHHNELLRLVEMERVLKPKPKKSLGLRERILLGMNGLMITLRSRTKPKQEKFVCRSSCDEAGVCIV